MGYILERSAARLTYLVNPERETLVGCGETTNEGSNFFFMGGCKEEASILPVVEAEDLNMGLAIKFLKMARSREN